MGSKREYEAIAKVVRSSAFLDGQKNYLAMALGEALAQFNPRFDLKKFVEACTK